MTDQKPRTYHFIGNLIHFLAFPDETDGCAIIEFRVAPGAGAPPHHHANEDENFYVLSGEFEFMMDGEVSTASAGDFVKIRKGSVHAFTCTSDAPGRLLGVTVPGRPHEKFFTSVGEPMPDGTTDFPEPSGPPDFAFIIAKAAEAGTTILPPDGAPG